MAPLGAWDRGSGKARPGSSPIWGRGPMNSSPGQPNVSSPLGWGGGVGGGEERQPVEGLL